MTPAERALAERVGQYRAAADRAGQSLPCLAADWDRAASPVCQVTGEEGGEATVNISGPIDYWFGLDLEYEKKRVLALRPSAVRLLINSPGGNLFDSLGFYSFLRQLQRDGVPVTAYVQGLCASAATLVLLGADERYADEASLLMIHNPRMLVVVHGEAADLEAQFAREMDMLARASETTRGVYEERLTLGKDEIASALDAETWYSAAEAVEAGLATALAGDAAPDASDAPGPEAVAAATRLIDGLRAAGVVADLRAGRPADLANREWPQTGI